MAAMRLPKASDDEKTSRRANLVCPGPMATMLRAQAFPGENPEDLPTPDSIADTFVDLASTRSTQNGARIVIPH